MGEVRYTLEGCALGLREDGRDLLDYRYCALDVGILPQAGGSCRLRAGGTEIVVAVMATLAAPDVLTPTLGRIVVAVSCGGPGDCVANGLPDYGALAQGSLDSESRRLWLEGSLRQLYSASVVTDALRTLSILPGQQCWELRAHVLLVRVDGCPLDAAALAVRAALHNTRIPRIAVAGPDAAVADTDASGALVGGGGASAAGRLDLDESLDESVPFDASALPLYVTLAHLNGALVADCTAKERHAAGGALSLALDSGGRVAALCGGGGFGMPLQLMTAAVTTARALCVELHACVQDAIARAADAAERRGGAAACEGVGCSL